MYTYMYIKYTHTHTHTHAHTHIYVYIYVYIFMYKHTHAYHTRPHTTYNINQYIYMHTNSNTNTHIYTHTHTYRRQRPVIFSAHPPLLILCSLTDICGHTDLFRENIGLFCLHTKLIGGPPSPFSDVGLFHKKSSFSNPHFVMNRAC